MTAFEMLMQPAWQNLVFALLHTLWQSAVLALVMYAVLRWLPVRWPNARYVLTLGAQCGVLLAGFITWAVLNSADALPPPESRPFVLDSDLGRTERDAAPQTALAERPDSASDSAASSDPLPRAMVASEPALWVAWIAGAWLLGVALMVLRNVVSVVRARRISRGTRVTDAGVLAAVEQLRRELRIGRHVRVVWCELATSPAVLGIIWPTLAFPASMLTGLSPESLRAILAHELAHIRRHDYLINLLQLAIESLLFFNPAVWWIGRQVRAEREACCDALAVAITGQPLGYSETLAHWSQRQPFPAAAVAWTGPGGRKPVLDRIRRLLLPGYRPDVPLSWSGLAGLLVFTPLMLAALWQGTTMAVAAAAQILSPSERIEKLGEVVETHGSPRRVAAGSADQETFTVSGQVRMEDGSPLPPGVDVGGAMTIPFGISTVALKLDAEGRFSKEEKGSRGVELYLRAQAPDHAVTLAGPFEPKPGEHLKDVELIIRRGFSGRIRFVDESGSPIAGVALEEMTYWLPKDEGTSVVVDHPLRRDEPRSDDQGIVAIDHCSDWPLHVEARRGGYQFDRRELELQPGETVEWPLRAARPTTGTVVSADDGRPVAGARLYADEHYRLGDPRERRDTPLLAVSDAQGRFRLDTLRDDSSYLLYIEAEGHAVKLIPDVRAGQQDLPIPLDPPLRLRGRLLGRLNELPTDWPAKRPYFTYRNPVRASASTFYDAPLQAYVDIRDGVGTFEINRLFPGHLELELPGRTVRMEMREAIDNWEIDLTDEPSVEDLPHRTVIVHLDLPADAVPPRGTLRIGWSMNNENRHQTLELDGSEIRMEAPVGSRFSYNGDELLGYWIEGLSTKVPAGDEPLRIAVPAHPAGAIYGRVLAAADSPARGSVRLLTIEHPDGMLFSPMRDTVSLRRDDGRFAVSPLPLGGRYRVLVSEQDGKSRARVLSDILTVDAQQPLHELDLQLPEGKPLHIQVLDPDGNPAPDVHVSFVYNTPHGGGYGDTDVTDSEGRLVVERVNPDLPGRYSLTVEPTQTFRGQRVRVTDLTQPLTVRLKRGVRLSGVLLNADGNEPLPHTQVTASVTGRDAEYTGAIDVTTDHAGRFEFQNLEPLHYRLSVFGAKVERITPSTTINRRFPTPVVRAGDEAPVTVIANPAE